MRISFSFSSGSRPRTRSFHPLRNLRVPDPPTSPYAPLLFSPLLFSPRSHSLVRLCHDPKNQKCNRCFPFQGGEPGPVPRRAAPGPRDGPARRVRPDGPAPAPRGGWDGPDQLQEGRGGVPQPPARVAALEREGRGQPLRWRPGRGRRGRLRTESSRAWGAGGVVLVLPGLCAAGLYIHHVLYIYIYINAWWVHRSAHCIEIYGRSIDNTLVILSRQGSSLEFSHQSLLWLVVVRAYEEYSSTS